MYKHVFMAAGLLLALPSLAQTKTDRAQVNWGPERSDKEDGNFQYVLGTTADAIYLKMNRKKDQLIQKTDLSLKTVYQKSIDKDLLEDDDLSMEKIVLVGDKFLVFTRKYDKKADQNVLYGRVYNESDYTPVAARKRVAKITAEKANNPGSFSVELTSDEKNVRITISEPWVKKEAGHNRTVTLDADLNEVTGDAMEAQRVVPDDFTVDDRIYAADGTLIYVGRKYPEKRERKALRRQDKPDHTYCLLVYEQGSSIAKEYPIQVADKFLQDLTFREDVNGDILCGGFYGNKASWSIRGVLFMRLDKTTKEVTHQSFKEFENDFITEGMSEKEEKKAVKKAEKKDEELELPNYNLDDIVRRDDGGAVLVAEQFQTYTVCYTDKYGTRCTTHYIYNDIIVVNIDPQGNIEWAKKIVKRQHTANDGGYYSSYAMHVKDDKLYFLFNDSGENLFRKDGDKVKQFELKGDDAMVTLVTIENDGTMHREPLLTQERKGDIFKPSDCRSFPDDRMFIYATRKNDYRFGMLTFK